MLLFFTGTAAGPDFVYQQGEAHDVPDELAARFLDDEKGMVAGRAKTGAIAEPYQPAKHDRMVTNGIPKVPK